MAGGSERLAYQCVIVALLITVLILKNGERTKGMEAWVETEKNGTLHDLKSADLEHLVETEIDEDTVPNIEDHLVEKEHGEGMADTGDLGETGNERNEDADLSHEISRLQTALNDARQEVRRKLEASYGTEHYKKGYF